MPLDKQVGKKGTLHLYYFLKKLRLTIVPAATTATVRTRDQKCIN